MISLPSPSVPQEFKGYVFKIMGGQDKQGFPMKQGVLTNGRVQVRTVGCRWLLGGMALWWQDGARELPQTSCSAAGQHVWRCHSCMRLGSLATRLTHCSPTGSTASGSACMASRCAVASKGMLELQRQRQPRQAGQVGCSFGAAGSTVGHRAQLQPGRSVQPRRAVWGSLCHPETSATHSSAAHHWPLTCWPPGPTTAQVLMSPGDQCFRGYGRRNGERRRKSVRGCIVSQDLSVLNLVIVKKGERATKLAPGCWQGERSFSGAGRVGAVAWCCCSGWTGMCVAHCHCCSSARVEFTSPPSCRAVSVLLPRLPCFSEPELSGPADKETPRQHSPLHVPHPPFRAVRSNTSLQASRSCPA